MNSPDFLRSFDEIDLVAYHLHELSPEQELAVRNALQLNPALAAQAKAIAATLHMFERQEYPTMIGTEVLDNHWQRLRPSLTPHRTRSPFAAWGLPIALATAVTALLVVAFWFASWSSSSMQQAAAPQTASSAPSGPSPSPVPPAAHSPAAHTSTSDQRETQPTPQPFNRISIPSIEPAFESAPINTNLAFANLPNELIFPIAPLSTSAAPTPPPNPAPAATPPPAHRRHIQTDFSVGVFGNLIAARTKTDISQSPYFPYTTFTSQSASPSAGVVGSFHQQFGSWLGYRVASSYARNTFAYTNTIYPNTVTTPGATYTSTSLVNGSAYELTASYTVQGPSGKRVSTDAEVGAGALLFEPSPSPPTNPSGQLGRNRRRTVLGGVGFNFKLTPHLDLRAEYRVLVYKNPGFGLLPNTRYTASSEPTVGVTYHFGGK